MTYAFCPLQRRQPAQSFGSDAEEERCHPIEAATVLGGSGTSVTLSLAGQMLPMVAPVPSMGWADVGFQRVPSEVAEQPTMAAIPLSTIGRIGLPTPLMAPTVLGMT